MVPVLTCTATLLSRLARDATFSYLQLSCLSVHDLAQWSGRWHHSLDLL